MKINPLRSESRDDSLQAQKAEVTVNPFSLEAGTKKFTLTVPAPLTWILFLLLLFLFKIL